MLHYVTERRKASGELLTSWAYYKLHDAWLMKLTQEAATAYSKDQTIIDIEILDVDVEPYPPKIKKHRAPRKSAE
jgi:hypothetical protein